MVTLAARLADPAGQPDRRRSARADRRAVAARPDAKLPSIRAFAAAHGVSVFTVVEAYDRLVAQGWLTSRAHSGFFVKRRAGDTAATGERGAGRSALRRALVSQADLREPQPGAQARLRLVAARLVVRGRRAAEPAPPGRRGRHARRLRLATRPHGAARCRRRDAGRAPDRRHGRQRAADAGLEPGARSRRAPAREARRRRAGRRSRLSEPDVHAALPRRAPDRRAADSRRATTSPRSRRCWREYQPKAFFTQPRLQSPTNSVAPISQLYRVLQLAEQHDVTLVENDIYADLDPRAAAVAGEPGPAEARGLHRQLLEDHLAQHARRLPRWQGRA